MKEDDQTLAIPLLSFASPMQRFPLDEDCRETASFPVVWIKGSNTAAGRYGVKIDDDNMAPVLRRGMVAVFSQKGGRGPEDIFSIGRKGELPLVRKVVKNEIHSEAKTGPHSRLGGVRKSFMTPTPLHIPGSRFSPIADSTHSMIYFKKLQEPEELTLLPAEQLLWMHPLASILPVGNF